MKLFAWASFVLAVIGGAGLVALGYTKTVLIIAAIGVLIVVAIDIIKDKVPNQYAVIGAFVIPSLIVGVGGAFPDALRNGLTHVWGWGQNNLGEWVNTTTLGLPLFAVAISFIVSQKTMSAGGRR